MRILLLTVLLALTACQSTTELPEDFDPTFEF